jgi:hypothetical protein
MMLRAEVPGYRPAPAGPVDADRIGPWDLESPLAGD